VDAHRKKTRATTYTNIVTTTLIPAMGATTGVLFVLATLSAIATIHLIFFIQNFFISEAVTY
tara:strand:- start:84 stop:269 length:186 start_codon:yes stop_codon:yes gene_type:complete